MSLGDYYAAFVWLDMMKKHEARLDWGYNQRWYVSPSRDPNWKDWLVSGPQWNFFVIPVPEHGTFYQVWRESRVQMLGITGCCTAIYMLAIFIQGDAIQSLLDTIFCNSPQLLIFAHTDFFNLMANFITAPILIYRGWRKEPADFTSTRCGGFCSSREADDSSLVLYDHRGHPFFILEPEVDERKALAKQIRRQIVVQRGASWTIRDLLRGDVTLTFLVLALSIALFFAFVKMVHLSLIKNPSLCSVPLPFGR